MDARKPKPPCLIDLHQLATSPASISDAAGTIKGALPPLLLAYLQGDVNLEQFRSALKPLAPLTHPTLPDTLADVLWLGGCEVDKGTEERKKKFADLVRTAADGLVPQSLLIDRLDFTSLEAAGVVDLRTRKDYSKRNTQRLYVAAKFNLLRESNEGYAKLLTHAAELHTNGPAPVSEWLATVRLLLGYFRLDPYRVYALLQDVWEHDLTPGAPVFLPTLKQFPGAVCAAVTGFKLAPRVPAGPDAPAPPVDAAEGSAADSPAFYELVALLIGNGLLGLIDVYQHVIGPEPGKAEAKGRLLLGLLRAKKHEPALELLALAAPWSFGGPRDGPLLQELLSYCGDIIEGLYRLHCTSYAVLGRGRSQASLSQSDLLHRLKSYGVGIMCHVGAHFANHVPLFTKLCRLLFYFRTTKDPEMEPLVRLLLGTVVLPSLTVTAPNPALNLEIWQVLSLYPYEGRYELYGPLRDQVWDGSLAEIRKAANERMDQALQAMTGPVDTKYIQREGRHIARLAHSHPMLVTERLVGYVAKHRGDFSATLLDWLGRLAWYFTPLALDVLLYQLLLRVADVSTALAGKKTDDSPRLAEDTTTLNNLARFLGLLYRRHFAVLDVTPFLHFLQRRLQAGSAADVVLLDQLLQRAIGTKPGQADEAEVSLPDLQLFKGGPLLRAYNATDLYFNPSTLLSRGSQQAMRALIGTLATGDVGRTLVLLMGQLRTHYFAVHDEERATMATPLLRRYDFLTDALGLLVHFLGYADQLLLPGPVTRGALIGASRLHPLADLVEAGLDLPVAFAVVRPALPVRPVWQEAEATKFFGPSFPRLLPSSIRGDPFLVRLYLVFWTMELKDVLPGAEAYKAALLDLQQDAAKDRSKLRDALARSGSSGDTGAETLRLAINGATKDALATALQAEATHEKAVLDDGQQRLLGLVSALNGGTPPSDADKCVWAFIQECLLPRACLSAIDATYCARFVYFLHELNVPFPTLALISTILTSAPFFLMGVTHREAHRIGCLVALVTRMMTTWRQDPAAYTEACGKSVGFREDMGSASTQISHDRYCDMFRRFHSTLADRIERCLEGEWYQQRNCLTALKLLHPMFPQQRRDSGIVLSAVGPLRSHAIGDVREVARDYHSLLSRQPYDFLDADDQGDDRSSRGDDDRSRARRRARDDSPPASSKKYAADDKGKSNGRPRHKDSGSRR